MDILSPTLPWLLLFVHCVRCMALQGSPAAARAWLARWQTEHVGQLQYHSGTPTYRNGTVVAESRIPRLVLSTVANVTEAFTNWGHNLNSIREFSPEYHHLVFDDTDCESFLAACCSEDERLAFQLVKTGTQKNNVFIALFMRDIGGVTIEQDSKLIAPLAHVIPPWAAYAISPYPCGRSTIGCWDYGLLAAEPRTPVWVAYAQLVVHNVLRQAKFACERSKDGCKGFMGCVQDSTAMTPYEAAKNETLREYGCDMSPGPWKNERCAQATHSTLRCIATFEWTSVMKHSPCHNKAGARHRCIRPNENKPHYVSLPAAAQVYYRTPAGRVDGSSAPAYYAEHGCASAGLSAGAHGSGRGKAPGVPRPTSAGAG